MASMNDQPPPDPTPRPGQMRARLNLIMADPLTAPSRQPSNLSEVAVLHRERSRAWDALAEAGTGADPNTVLVYRLAAAHDYGEAHRSAAAALGEGTL
jgi:hypothetical protein